MATMALTLTSGRQIAFDVDAGGDGPAFFVLSLARSGSTLLNEIVEGLAAANGRRFIEVGVSFFEANIEVDEYSVDPALVRLVRPGNVYGGFRSLPPILAWSELFSTGRKVLLVRDPRDALVSLYYSDAYSHLVPEPTDGFDDVRRMMEERRQRARSMSIDDYVIERARPTARILMGYLPLIRSSTVRWLRYEDTIFEKSSLIASVAEHFGWKADDEVTARIVSTSDVLPEAENPLDFIRQVKPGDHVAKLRPATVVALNRILGAAMRPYGYTT
jgi:hypothetical protein